MKAEPSWFLIWLFRKTVRGQWEGQQDAQGISAPSLWSIHPPHASESQHQLPPSLNQHHNLFPTCCTQPSLKHQCLLFKWNMSTYRPSLNQRILILTPPPKRWVLCKQRVPEGSETDQQLIKTAMFYAKCKKRQWQEEIPAAPLRSKPFFSTDSLASEPSFPNLDCPAKHRA